MGHGLMYDSGLHNQVVVGSNPYVCVLGNIEWEASRVSAGDGSWSIFQQDFSSDRSIKGMKQTALLLLSQILLLGIKKPEL